MLKHLTYMNEAKMHQFEDRLATTYNQCLDTRRFNEEELKIRYVQKQKIEDLENKVQSLEKEISSLWNQLKSIAEVEPTQKNVEEIRSTVEVEIQIDDIHIGVIVQEPMINVEGEVP